MTLNTANERPVLVVGDVDNPAYSMADVLDSDELMTGTPTVVEVDTTDLTITNAAINTAALVINTRDVIIGKAVQFTVSGQLVANSPYRCKITFTTDASSPRTKSKYAEFLVEA